ncbi:hypothetical protein Vi05172_g5171 [Venturia inaequalis]|nr:hypothetical protein Vi05172_g5171 [Venturia inaequalis]
MRLVGDPRSTSRPALEALSNLLEPSKYSSYEISD